MVPGQERKKRRDERQQVQSVAQPPLAARVQQGVTDLARGAYNTARGVSNALGSLTVGPVVDAGANALALATGNDPRTRPGGIASLTSQYNAAARDAQQQVVGGAPQAIQRLGGRITGAQPLSLAPTNTGASPPPPAAPRQAAASPARTSPQQRLPAPAANVPTPSRAAPALATLPPGVSEGTGARGERAFSGDVVRGAPAPQTPIGAPSVTQRLQAFVADGQRDRALQAAESARINSQSAAEVGRQQEVNRVGNDLRVARRGSTSARQLRQRLAELQTPAAAGRPAGDIAAQGLLQAQAGQATAAAGVQTQESLAAQLNNQTAAENRQRLQQLATLGPDDPSRRGLIDALVAGAGRDPDADRFVAVDSIIGTDAFGNPVQGRQLYDTRSGTQVGGQVGGKPAAPTKGTVQDGYRFKGGDPADPNNWEAV